MSKGISEEFKDQKINDLLEDYIHLENEIKSIPEKLHDSLHSVSTAIDSLPSNLEVSINKLAAAVQEAENSFDELAVKHRSIINNQLDEAKLEIRSAIKNEIIGGMSDEIKNANQQLNLLSRKIASSGSNNIGTRLLMFLGLNVITALLAICLSGYFYYDSLQHQKDVKRIEKRFNEYKNDISQIQKRLPKNVNDKLMETTKEYFKKN